MNEILQGDSLSVLKTLPDAMAHCVITSPPYYGLRDYGIPGQLGLEPTPEAHIAAMVEIFREVRRVMHPTGCLFLNYGDSYWGGKGENGSSKARRTADERGYQQSGGTIQADTRPTDGKHEILKPKDLLMIPFRVAMALQADGWYLRSVIPWLKRNSMPESVTDRPASATEYLFLLAKSQKYFYDNEAVRVPARNPSPRNDKQRGHSRRHAGFNDRWDAMTKEEQCSNGRSRRNSDWFFESWQGLYDEGDGPLALVVNPQPFKESHFATFPEKLVIPCLKAGTSNKGACPDCGQPWERVVDHTNAEIKLSQRALDKRASGLVTACHGTQVSPAQTTTLGWQPTCKCGKEPVPCVVLDPFMGAGTVALVAKKYGRSWLGIELNPDYILMATNRINSQPNPLFT